MHIIKRRMFSHRRLASIFLLLVAVHTTTIVQNPQYLSMKRSSQQDYSLAIKPPYQQKSGDLTCNLVSNFASSYISPVISGVIGYMNSHGFRDYYIDKLCISASQPYFLFDLVTPIGKLRLNIYYKNGYLEVNSSKYFWRYQSQNQR